MGMQPTKIGWFNYEEVFLNEEDNTFDFLKYHTSWDWLMPVVGKITRDEMLIGNEYRESIMDTVPYGLIEDTHKVVVEFITWYNEKKRLA